MLAICKKTLSLKTPLPMTPLSMKTRFSHLAISGWYPLLCLFILAVSLYDTYLIVEFSESLIYMEENPVGQWLIRVAHGEVGVFVRVKLAGTLIVLLALAMLRRFQRKQSVPVSVSVASFQAGLFTYLSVG